jgi:MFS family permease
MGLALGVYGLVQAVLQIPFGLAADRWGRKRVMLFGLALFAVGSLIAAGAAAIRHDIVLVGGAPLNEEFSRAIGADAYCRDAAVAVETAKAFVARKHNRASA